MAYSTQRAVSDGSLQLLMIEIEFFDKSEITAYFDNIPTTEFIWATDKSLRFNDPVPNGIEVLLRRTTDLSQPRHIFSQGAQFKDSTLDEDFKQILHISQEAVEGANVGDIYQPLNMHGNTITNVGPALADGDAVSLGQVKQESTSAWTAAADARQSAGAAAGSAMSANNAASTAIQRANEAATAAADSAARRDLARKWAANPVDVPVEPGMFSAFHYASKSTAGAAAAAASAVTAKNEADRGVDLVAQAQVDANRAATEADRATAQAALTDPDRVRHFAITGEEIITGFEAGGVLRPKNGLYYMLRKALFNYAGVVGFAGHYHPRQSVVGEVPGGTIMSVQHADWCMESTGPAPFAAATGGGDEFGNMTFVGPDVTGGAGAIGSGKGLRISNRAGTHLHDLTFINLERPLHLDGVLSSNVSRIGSSGCYHPILINTTDVTSAPNAMSYNDVRVANHVTHGVVAECGAAMHWSRFTGEGCGRVGSQDVVFSLTSSYEPFAGVSSVHSPYFELNAGLADMYFENKTNGPMVIHVTGGLFARVSADRFVEYHILANNLGGGSLDVFVYDSIFIEGFGYPASAARPITRAVGDRCRIHLVNPRLLLSNVTPVPLSHSPTGDTLLNLEGTGGLYNPGGWTSVRTPGGAPAGDFLITRDVPIARNVYSYFVQITQSDYADIPDTSPVLAGIKCRRLTERQFRVRTYDSSGVQVDAGVDIRVGSLT